MAAVRDNNMINSSKKKVLLLVPMLHQGGFERVCAMTAKMLQETCQDSHQVYLVVFNTQDQFYDVSGVELIDLQLGARDSLLGKLLNIAKRVIKVRKLKKELDIQVSYSFGQTANIVNVLSKRQDVTWAGIRGYGALSDRREMKLICRLADRVVSCTKVMEEEIAKSFPIKSSAALYNPCDLQMLTRQAKEPIPESFASFLEQEGELIVSMGREDDVKGFWHLLKSMAILKKEYLPKAKLMIIGEGDYTEYRELAEELGIAKDVLFTGVQKNPFSLLAKAQLYALTSESEGFPNALIEAMSLGVPCISVDCMTGPAEILCREYTGQEPVQACSYADYGILMPVFPAGKDMQAQNITKEERQFAKQMAEILTNQQTWQHYREKALQRAQDFSVQAYREELIRLLETECMEKTGT